jgi:hypothetical protein
MENMTQVAPNQLPLFANMLTVEQEQRLADAKASATKQMNRQLNEVLRKVAIVDAAGFTSSHYGYNTDCKKVMRSINVNRWSEEPHMTEVELDQFSGHFYITFDEYDKTKNEIVKRKTGIDVSGDKIECYGLNQNSRKMKPETILANIAKAAEKAHYEFARANTVKSIVKYTVNKYKKLYPNAEVEAGKGYNSGRGNWEEFEIVTVKFPSGSYIVLRTTTTPDSEYAHKTYNAVTSKMTNAELMDHFNAQ